MDNDRQKALDTVIKNMEKSFGKGAVMKLGDNEARKVSSVSSGSVTLDNALGVGGYPKGRIIEIYGPESSGKTTVALHAIAEVQKNGGIAAFIDAEHALDPVYAEALGVDIQNLYLSQPDHGEQGLEIAEAFVRSGAVDIVVVDSVAALTPKAEIEGEMGDTHVGLQARLMSQALRKLSGAINASHSCFESPFAVNLIFTSCVPAKGAIVGFVWLSIKSIKIVSIFDSPMPAKRNNSEKIMLSLFKK